MLCSQKTQRKVFNTYKSTCAYLVNIHPSLSSILVLHSALKSKIGAKLGSS